MSGTVEDLLARLEQGLAQASPEAQLPRLVCQLNENGRTCTVSDGPSRASAAESQGRVTRFAIELQLADARSAELERQHTRCEAMLAIIDPDLSPMMTSIWRDRMRGAATEFHNANTATLTRNASNGGSFSFTLIPRVSIVCSLSERERST